MSNQLDLGGTEKALQTYVRHLDRELFEVDICGLYQGGPRGDDLRHLGFRVEVLGGDWHRFTKLLIENAVEIVHIHRSGLPEADDGDLVAAIEGAGRPAIVQTNVFGAHNTGPLGRIIDANLFISKMCALRYMRRTGQSPAVFLERNRVVYYPLDVGEIDRIWTDLEDGDRLRADLGLAAADFVVGRIGRPDVLKWSDFLVAGLEHLFRMVPQSKAVLMGVPESAERRIRSSRLLADRVRIVSPSSDQSRIVAFYKIIDVLAHSSRIGESFGYTLAEAMGCRRPVVVNSTPWADNAQVELIDHGETGLIANFPRTFAAALAYLAANPDVRWRMGNAGRKKVLRYYEAGRVTRELERVYADVLRRRAGAQSLAPLACVSPGGFTPDAPELAAFSGEYDRRCSQVIGRPTVGDQLEMMRLRLKEHRERVHRRLHRHLRRPSV